MRNFGHLLLPRPSAGWIFLWVLAGACLGYAPAGDAQGGNPATPAKPSEAKAGSNDHMWLTVQGKQIVTSPKCRGGSQPFIPVGLGYCKEVTIKAPDDKVAQFLKERNMNTIRLSFYTCYFNNDFNKPINIDAHLKNHVGPVVQAAKKHKMYVILDDHAYFSAQVDEARARQRQTARIWDEQGIQSWIARWVKVARAYKDEPYVLGYELQNEPHDIPPEKVRDWYTRCIKAIRNVDTRHIIIVGSHDWTHARSMEATWGAVAKTVDEPYNQIVFAFHDYPTDNDPPIVRQHVTAFRDRYNVPVLCSEFGALPKHSEAVNRQFESGMMAMCAQEKIGWMIWTLWGLNDRDCAYPDIWIPAAKEAASPMPELDSPGAAPPGAAPPAPK